MDPRDLLSGTVLIKVANEKNIVSKKAISKSSTKAPKISHKVKTEQDFLKKVKFEYPSFDVSLRWRCCRLLQCCICETDYPSMVYCDPKIEYIKQMEEYIYQQSYHSMEQYRHKIQQLCFAFKKNFYFLYQKYTPNQLISISDSLLMEGTKEDEEKKQIESRANECSKLLSNVDIFGHLESYAQIVKCPKCKGGVFITPHQKSSQDEGMNILYTCLNLDCKYGWEHKGK